MPLNACFYGQRLEFSKFRTLDSTQSLLLHVLNKCELRHKKLGGRSVFDVVPQGSAFSFLNKTQLVKLRLKAMRAGVWFKALRRIDRVLFDLTIRVVRYNVRSVALVKSIRAVMGKLEGLLESGLSRVIREVGFPLAQKVSSLAQKWGSTSANEWSSDSSFVSFLAVLSINEPKTFKL